MFLILVFFFLISYSSFVYSLVAPSKKKKIKKTTLGLYSSAIETLERSAEQNYMYLREREIQGTELLLFFASRFVVWFNFIFPVEFLTFVRKMCACWFFFLFLRFVYKMPCCWSVHDDMTQTTTTHTEHTHTSHTDLSNSSREGELRFTLNVKRKIALNYRR